MEQNQGPFTVLLRASGNGPAVYGGSWESNTKSKPHSWGFSLELRNRQTLDYRTHPPWPKMNTVHLNTICYSGRQKCPLVRGLRRRLAGSRADQLTVCRLHRHAKPSSCRQTALRCVTGPLVQAASARTDGMSNRAARVTAFTLRAHSTVSLSQRAQHFYFYRKNNEKEFTPSLIPND